MLLIWCCAPVVGDVVAAPDINVVVADASDIGATVVVTGLKRYNISKNFFSTFCKRERVQKKIVLGSAEVETTFFILIEKKFQIF